MQETTPNTDPLIGTKIADRFLILDLIGKGGMGRVYKALQTSVSRVVALKLLPPQVVDREERAERFAREARLTAKLRSENTITVYDFGSLEDGSMFLAMELIEGRSLQSILKQEGRLDPMRVARLVDQISRSLEEAHDAGLIHRDLKPGNVMIEATKEDERAKVLDFGIAKMIETPEPTLTQTGAVFGTPQFMSPEQCQGDLAKIGPASDLYSLGVMIFQLLTGHLPFSDSKLVTLLMLHVNEPPPKLTRHLPQSPIIDAYQRILDRLLAKHPDERFASARELRDALSTALAVQQSAPKRRPLPAIAGGSAVLAAIAIGYLSRTPDRPPAIAETVPPPSPPPALVEAPPPPPPPSPPPIARQLAWRGTLEAATNLDPSLGKTLASIEAPLARCAEKSGESEIALTAVVLSGGKVNLKAPHAFEACVRPIVAKQRFVLTGGAFGSFRYVLRKR